MCMATFNKLNWLSVKVFECTFNVTDYILYRTVLLQSVYSCQINLKLHLKITK